MRARSRAAVSLVVIAAWFGTLLVAAPTAAPASAATGDPGPSITAGPSGRHNDPSPQWTFTLDPTTSSTTSTVDPTTSDTTTVTIDITHQAECAVSDTNPPASYDACGNSISTPQSLTYTAAPALTTNGNYAFYVHDVRTTTTRTVVEFANPVDPAVPTSDSGPIAGAPDKTDDSVSAAYTFDDVAPTVAATTSPPAGGPTGSAGWVFTASEPAAVTCSLTGPTPLSGLCGPGDPSFPGQTILDGSYTISARATDVAGNTGPALTSTYDLDTSAPVLTVVGPAASDNDTTPAWTVTADGNQPVTCTLFDGTEATGSVVDGPTSPCDAFGPSTPLSTEGLYTLVATAADSAGNAAKVSSTYLLDLTAPTLTLQSGPDGITANNTTPTWTVTSSGGEVVTCTLTDTTSNAVVAGPTAGCTSFGTTLVANDTYVLTATATDSNHNVAGGTMATYTLDTAGPAFTVTGPSGAGNDTTPRWTVTANGGETVACTLTDATTGTVVAGPSSGGCSSFPAGTTLTADDTYRLSATATDIYGNTTTATVATYVLDTVAPVFTVVTGPGATGNNTQPRWTVTADGGETVTCTLYDGTSSGGTRVGGPTAGCGGFPGAVTLSANDTYTLVASATDTNGNTTTQDVATYLLDTVAPAPFTVSGTTGDQNTTVVNWTWTATDISSSCQLQNNGVAVGSPVAGCNSPWTTALPGEGAWTLQVTLTDAVGNSTSGVSPEVRVDQTLPAAPGVSTPTLLSNDRAPVWTLTGEAGAVFSCSWTSSITPPTPLPGAGSCTSGYAPTLPNADGTYTLHVTQTDLAGNVSVETPKAYVLDVTKPSAPVVSGPTGPSKQTTVTWSYTTTETVPPTLLCALTHNGTPVETFAPCASLTRTLPTGTADGDYVFSLELKDAAGNISNAGDSPTYVLDTTAPALPVFTSQPTGTDNLPDVNWAFSMDADATAECQLVKVGTATPVQPWASCGTPHGATLTYGDGDYFLEVRLTDPYLNTTAVVDSATYTLDLTAPGAPTVSGPTGTSNTTTANYAIVGPVEALATAECKLTRDATVVVSDWAACNLPRTVNLGTDGSYVLEVRLTDQYGNLGPAGASPAYLLDTKLPTVPVVTAPASPSSNGAPVFTFVTDGDTTTTCQASRGSVVAVAATACTGSFTASLAGQPDGDYVVTVTATDPAGNTATGTSSAYTFDTTKPIAPVVTGPAGPSQTRNPSFSWTGEAGARPECSLQEKAGSPGPWTACATSYAPALPADGSWVLSVRLVDAAGNVSDPGQSGAYVLDTTAPATPAVNAPPSPGRDLAPSWSAAIEEGSHADCRLTGPGQLGTWAPCTLPLTTPIGGDGTYTFEVRTTDVAGNVSQVGSATYALDTTAPVAPVVVQPTSPGRNRTPTVSFTSETGTTGSCKLTRGSAVLSDSAPCSSPTTLNLTGLPDGAYTLSVRAVDAAGNIGPAGTATYVLDTTAPAVPTMTLVAGSPSSDRAPVFGFNVELGTTPSCKVTLASGAVRDLTCTSPVTLDLSGATDGDYVLTIRTTDPAGNVSAPATTTYHLDGSAPAAPKVVGPTTPGSIRNPVWKISSSSPAECRLLRTATVVKDWAPCGTSYAADLFAQTDAVYILEARVIGTTAATMSRYRLDTSGPAAASIVGPPSPSTDRKPTWAVASPDTTVRAECRVTVFTGVLKDWAACPVSPAGSLFSLDLTGLGDGTYSLLVRLTDAAGNLGPVATSDYVLDTSAPAAVGVIAPLSPGNDTTPTWTLTSAAGVKLECRLSSGQKVISEFAPCTGEFTADLSGLPDGTYTLTVHALSAAGTPGPETTSGYILDTTAAGAPGTLTGPTGPSRNRAPTWTFTLAPGTTAVCKVTFGGKVLRDGPCTSPFTVDLSNAADGTYTLTVRAVDAAGNLGSPSSAGYILKTTPPPAPVLTMQPGSPSSTTGPTWGFSLGRGTSAQCRLLQSGSALEDWAACGTAGATNGTVTALLSGKPDGGYTMQVRAIDEAQNTSPAVAGDYVFDRSAAPLAMFVQTPATPGNDTSPTWVVAAPPADTTPTTAPVGTAALVRAAALTGTPQTECRLTTPRGVGSWAPCAGRYIATTNGDGTYLLEVRAFDTAGERGPASSSSYLLDTRAPAAPRLVDPMPPAVGNDAEVVWSWADDGNLVQCRLLRNGSALGGFTACDLLYVANVGRQGEATYTIEARAVDAAGNVSPVTADSYRYDITPPTAPVFVNRPPARGSSSSVGWTYIVPIDTHAVCVVTRNGTVISEGACGNAFGLDLRGQQPATWVLSVHLVDAAGNAGQSSSGSYTLLSAIGRGRVSGPTGSGPDGGPGGSGPGTGSGPLAAGPDKNIPGIDKEQPRAGALRIPPVVKKTIKKVARVASGIPGAVPGTDVPKAVKNVLRQTITKPQLPLALFIIVLLFLLVQNRIDRRDPKLAAAPATAEPELTFGPILRPGGASA